MRKNKCKQITVDIFIGGLIKKNWVLSDVKLFLFLYFMILLIGGSPLFLDLAW